MYPDIIGGVAQIGSTYIASKTAERNTDKTNKANKELAEYAYSKDQEQWERQNAYNSPAEQMKRFAEAGLNPNLMYGQGTPGNASQMPQYQAPRQEYNYQPQFDPASAMNEFMDLRMKETNIASTEASIELQKQQTALASANAALTTAKETGVIQENTIRSIESSIATLMIEQYGTPGMHEVAQIRWESKKALEQKTILDKAMREWEVELTKMGISPRDNALYRAVQESLITIGIYGQELYQNRNKDFKPGKSNKNKKQQSNWKR